ncbi:hypothetical protein [Butyrivibrio sp. YAB3001]|uniref:hypothetical protein n=1 Tax=Butyrivibrio sp. YAB3001 TaxID=1520812 RepID=UPI0008F687C7|nr:hypothetical protein [Butyrivibrio sp. YAB3001]SFC34906.1 hypothetical protein SAMN02910398_02058 [Butyrivibrio sp. YAB3001]
MHKYLVYGLVVQSQQEIPQLVRTDSGNIDVNIFEEDVTEEVNRLIEDNGSLHREYYITKKFTAFSCEYGFFLIQNGNEIKYKRSEDHSFMETVTFILGYCFSIILFQRNIMAIHCSVVSNDKGAILISGNSGAGKSTVTRNFLEKGYRFMADDVAAVTIANNKPLVYHTFPYQKLCFNEIEKRNINVSEIININEERDKYLVPVKHDFEKHPQFIRFLVVITTGDVKDIVMEKLTGFEHFVLLRSNLFIHPLKGGWENEKEFTRMCLLVSSLLPVYLIIRPRERDTIEEVTGMIEKLCMM